MYECLQLITFLMRVIHEGHPLGSQFNIVSASGVELDGPNHAGTIVRNLKNMKKYK